MSHSLAAGGSVHQMILRRRLATQRLVGPRMPTATDVVRLLTCVQSQECAHAFWSLGMRSSVAAMAEVQAESTGAGFCALTSSARPGMWFPPRTSGGS